MYLNSVQLKFMCVRVCRDIVKLTAQFVARNGRQFLTNLMNREQRNYQFDFLRPQHSLFQYFTKLLEQYTKVRQFF
jgi:splicing factor 3A subunit 1